jgi:phospholipid/cholesterol/gamma-HCH transport system substrate-binding protein
MNKKINIEFILGLLILIISIICIFYYSSKINLFNKIETFQINSSFFDIGNVNIGNDVKIKGVKVGEVSGISLDQENYMAIITSSIDESVKIPSNSTFKISNNGFIGSPYIEIQLGESEVLLKNNDYTTDNIDAVSLEEIINNFIFK